MNIKPKKRGPKPGNGGRPPKQGAAMTERITIRASAHTARRWREIAAGDPSGKFAAMVEALPFGARHGISSSALPG